MPTPSSTYYGGEPVSVGRGYLIGSHPSYAPDGRKIAFLKHSMDGTHIWTVGVDGRDLRQLTTNTNRDPVDKTYRLPTNQEDHPAWSPDGSRIAFGSARSIGTDTWVDDIWVIAPDGSHLRQLTDGPGRKWKPVWSPDGSRIVFVSDHLGSKRMWMMNADGTNMRRVTDLGWLEEDEPTFSPDGKQLVFASGRGSASSLMIVNIDGTGLCELTTGSEPSWSTSGIVFVRYNDGYALWLIQPDGSGLHALPAKGSQPAWSPDGIRIAYEVDFDNIYVFNSHDGAVKPLTQLNAIAVVLYIKPGLANTINPQTDRKIPVAILWTPWFDPVQEIDQSSITFGPTGRERSPLSCAPEEVNQPGVADLVCYFDVADAFSPTQTEGVLRATGINGFLFEGRDSVRVLKAP